MAITASDNLQPFLKENRLPNQFSQEKDFYCLRSVLEDL